MRMDFRFLEVVLLVVALAFAGRLASAQDSRRIQNEARVTTTFSETLKAQECEEICNRSRTHPAMYFKYRQLRTTPSACLQHALQATQGEGLKNLMSDAFGSGGTTETARAAITCVTLPKAGPCGGDGATVMFMVSSSKDAQDASSLIDRLDARFGNPALIDCGTVLNPVDD